MDWEESDAGYELRSLHITVINMLNTDILTEKIIATQDSRDVCSLISTYSRSTSGMPSWTGRDTYVEKGERNCPVFRNSVSSSASCKKAARLDKGA